MKKSLTITNVIGVIAGIILSGCVYLLVRNGNVYNFRRRVSSRIFNTNVKYISSDEYNRDTLSYYDELADQIRYEVTYDDLLYSFKPLKIDNWYTPEQCAYLRKYWKMK